MSQIKSFDAARLRAAAVFCFVSVAFSGAVPVRAETRTWTAAAGGFSTEAEFVELKAGNVRLKLASGEVRDVPLDRLSAADQAYVRSRTSPPAASAPSDKDRLARTEQDAARSRTARDALRAYKFFAGAPESTEADRAAVAAKIAELEPLAERGLYRVGGKWVDEAEAIRVRKQADELMRHGLEVLKLGQEDNFRKKFAEASALEPEEIRADFALAVIYSSSKSNRNTTRAMQYYQTCLKRDPTNIGVLNNLALLAVRNGEYHTAYAHWRQAMSITPDQRVCHNVGKLVKQAGSGTVTISKAVLEQLTDLYISSTGEGKLNPTDPARGWLHLLTDDAGLDLDLDKTTTKANVLPADSDDGPVVGGGSGFVIDEHHIVTNAHVVDGGSAFEIQFGHQGKTETLKATVVATSKKPDLAILRVEKTLSNAVTLDPTPSRRGTDIMVLGYPEMFELGATLKATRGVISGLPNPALDNLYLYDAVTNGGNSGGPVFDSKGNVIAVHCIGVNTASRYGGGIPAEQLLTFLQKSLPTYRQTEAATRTLEWTAIDAKVSPATVLVWVRKRDRSLPATSIAGTLEDKSCLACRGVGATKCLNGGCVNGVMSLRVAGRTVKGACIICSGSGRSECTKCNGFGIDPEVLEASSRAKANENPANFRKP